MFSYDIDDEAVKLLKEAIDIFANGEMNHDIFSRELHSMGFQGLKRFHRLQSCKDRNKRIELQHKVIDLFGINLDPDWKSFRNIDVKSLEDYLNKYWDWESSVYMNLGRINNLLITKGFIEEARDISCDMKGVRKELEKINRMSQDLELTNNDMTYFKIMDKKLHDKIKEQEKEYGINY